MEDTTVNGTSEIKPEPDRTCKIKNRELESSNAAKSPVSRLDISFPKQQTEIIVNNPISDDKAIVENTELPKILYETESRKCQSGLPKVIL